MKKSRLLAITVAIFLGFQYVQAQDVKNGNYCTMPKAQLEAIAAKAESDYHDANNLADDAKSRMRDAKKAYADAKSRYKELKKQAKLYKKQIKDAEKALKLRGKLRDLSNH